VLIANYSYVNNLCGHNHSGVTNPLKWIRPHVMRGYFTYADEGPNDEQIRRDSFPTGTNPPYSLIMGDKGALLVSSNTTNGVGALTGNAAMGRAIAATIDGTGSITSNLSLIIQLACSDLNGIGGLSASMSGIVQMASTLAGTGNITASLQLISYVVCNMSGSGAVTANLRGTASLEADITPFTTLSPENLAASVWNSLAASFNSAGTMGEKMNDAGSAANPWTEVIESGYTAAEILRILAAVAAGKSSGQGSVFRDLGDTKDRVSGTVDSNGNRTSITIDES
jgi:hypothetical protein